MVRERIKELGGEVFTAYDNSGNAVDITIAKPSASFKNHNGKRRPVNHDLTTKYIANEAKQEAVVLIDELILHQSSKVLTRQSIRMDGLTITVKTIGMFGQHIFKIKITPLGRQHCILPIPQMVKRLSMMLFQQKK